MVTNLCSSWDFSSSQVRAIGSKRTDSASENRILCFRKLNFAFSVSQIILTGRIYIYYMHLSSEWSETFPKLASKETLGQPVLPRYLRWPGAPVAGQTMQLLLASLTVQLLLCGQAVLLLATGQEVLLPGAGQQNVFNEYKCFLWISILSMDMKVCTLFCNNLIIKEFDFISIWSRS